MLYTLYRKDYKNLTIISSKLIFKTVIKEFEVEIKDA